MSFHIANFLEAPRYSARAGEAMPLGSVCKVLDWGNGEQKLLKLGTGDAAYLSGSNYAVVTKFSTDPNQVASSNVPASYGSRVVAIASGDHVVACYPGSIMEYTSDLLDASLSAPHVGDDITVKDGKFCLAGTAGQASAQIVATVFRVFGTKTLIELL
jgi:hypothetical protein